MTTRPLEHLVFLSVIASGNPDEEEEGKIVLMAWQTLSLAKNRVLQTDMTYICPTSGMPRKGSLPDGVSEESLRDAPNLATALKQFHTSLTKLAGSTFSLMTLGAWPLRHYLHPEAHKHKLTLQRYLSHYLDLTKEFAKSFPSLEAPASLQVMTDNLGVDPSSETNIALNEVATMCSVVQKLIEQGHLFQCAEVVRGKTDITATPNPSQVIEDGVIRLRGLPFQASVQDVAGFLTGLNIIPGGIVLGINAVGRRTGEAIVALETAEQAMLGLKRHKHYLDQRYVEVYEATVEDFLRLAGVGGGASSGGGGGAKDNIYVVRMQGLPYRATEMEIVDFFGTSAPVKNGEDGILIIRYPDGRASGDAFAIFEEEGHLEEALKLDRTNLGTRYVELYKSSLKEFRVVLGRSGSAQNQQHFADLLGLTVESSPEMQGLRGKEKKFVKLRGLPWSCKPEDVVEFFGSLKEDIAPQGVHMVLNAVNRPTGECYVQLKTVDGANRAAMDLHKQYIKDRYIEVFQCSGDEVAQAILEHGTGGGTGGGGGGGGGRGYRGGGGGYRGGEGGGGGGDRKRHSSGASVKCRGLPYSAREEQLVDFFADYDVGYNDVEIIFNNDGRAAGIAFVTFSSRSLAQRAVKEMNGKHVGSRYVDLSLS